MNDETSRLIAETLRLDAEYAATRKAYLAKASANNWRAFEKAQDNIDMTVKAAAPRLARMLEVAVSALDREQSSRCDRVLAEIEKIAKGES